MADPTKPCGKDLVPQVDQAGTAGTALSFTGATDTLGLGAGVALGETFTLEAWVRPAGGSSGSQPLYGGGADPAHAAPSIWLIDGTGLTVGFGDGTALRSVTVTGVLTAATWQHVSAAFDGTWLTVCVNGVPVHAGQELAGQVPTATPVAVVGPLNAVVDELRLWQIPRTVGDVRAAMNVRLSGLEPGLAGYWRLDEGTGTQAFDQVAGQVATVTGAAWVTSDAPIGEGSGISRTALRMVGRRVAGGLGATVYYLQENAAGGYDGTPKPQKTAARVMLAAVTAPDGSAAGGTTPTGAGAGGMTPAGPGEVAVLDFGVAPDGRLADLPGEVTLTELSAATGSQSPNALLDMLAADESRVAGLEADVATHEQVIADLTSGIAIAEAAAQGIVPAQPPTGAAADLAALSSQVAQAVDQLGQLSQFAPNSQALAGAQQQLQKLQPMLAAAIDRHLAQLGTEQAELADLRAQLAAAQADLAALRGQAAGDVELPMPLLHLDPEGRSVSGAVLGFATTDEAPVLFDSALGRLGLYFRDADGAFSVAYYDTAVGRPRRTLPAGSGVLTFLARGAEADLAALTVTTAADTPPADPTLCTLSIATPLATETWHHLPRDPQQLAAIVNGSTTPPTPVGATAAAATGTVDSLTLAAPLTVALPAGALLAAGTTVLTVATAAAREAKTIPVTPTEVDIPAATTLTRIAYDYAGNAATTLPGAHIDQTSLLVAADARAATGQVALATAVTTGASAAARWFADPPGTTLDFDGTGTFAGVLTTTALRFDGATDWVSLGNPPALNVTGTITLEAWVRPTATDGFRDILARGYVLSPAAEVVLRVYNGSYQGGSWNGNDHIASAPIPTGDLNTWVHLAVVYDGAAWRLYRNGLLLTSTPDPVGAVPVTAGWAVGAAADGTERWFAGDIDEVRLWSRPRSAAEITDGLRRRLDGTEAGLVGYWYAIDGVLRDHSPSQVDGTSHGSPQAAASPPVLAAVTGFDTAGDLSIEAWVDPQPGDDPLAWLVGHHSATSSYLLALRGVPAALTFDGTSQYATIADTAALNLTGEITLEAWALPIASDNQLHYMFAHGLQADRQAEVALRLNYGTYQIGSYNGTDHYAIAPIPAADLGHWVHLAGVYDGSAWRLYRNGELLATHVDPVGAIPVSADWAIGASATDERFFAGGIGEVRLWSRARAQAEIAADFRSWLDGTEDGLVGCWRYDGSALVDQTPARRPVTLHGSPTPVTGPVPGFRAIGGAGPQYAQTVAPFAGGTWRHVAMTFTQGHGLHVAGSAGYLDAGTREALDLSRDLTVEVAVTLDDLNAPQGLLAKGVLGDGGNQHVPYALDVGTDGAPVFSFTDTDGQVQQQAGNPGAVTAGGFHRIGVTRKRNTTIDTSNGVVVDKWDDIAFVVDGQPAGGGTYPGKDAGSSSDPLSIGRAYAADGTGYSLRGTLAEVRLWNTARDATNLGAPISGKEVGLVAWWRLDEGSGNAAADSKGSSTAVLHGAVSWVNTPDPTGSALALYVDGSPVAAQLVPAAGLAPAADGFSVGAADATQITDRLRGQLEEVRIWRTARTTEQIQDNLFRRLTDEQDSLIAYYTFDAEPGAKLSDQGPAGNDLSVLAGSYLLSTAPVAEDAPQVRNAVIGLTTDYTTTIAGRPGVAEYADLQTAAGGAISGVFKRCYAAVGADGGWRLITGFKVGDMTADWVGQAQFDPQLIGYVEGAPPVPSENLTVASDGYAGASSVSLTDAATTTYTYSSSRNAGIDASLEVSTSVGDKSQTLVGLVEIEAPLGLGVGEMELETVVDTNVSGGASLSVDTSTSWLASSQSGMGSTLTQVSTLDLTGHQEPATAVAFPALGPRWVPDNTGLALVQSQTADIYALRLVHTGALIAYQMLPNPDIPRDWNLITFPIDPHYTKQGTLDGKVGLQPDSDYPAALTYSPDSSYFKPIEAYQLKQGIDQQEADLATFFAQYDAGPGGLSADTMAAVPQPTKRSLANTYVWTAAGGRFAETEQTLDTRSETTGGSFTLNTALGANVTADVAFATVALTLDVTASVGAHLELDVSKTSDSETAFEVDVTDDPERDISTVNGAGVVAKIPGKVDAYRFMTFYLAPQSGFHDAFYNQVVDPIWLAQSTDPDAAALRQARQPDRQPACWRVLHRVTYVSRVLAPLSSSPSPLDTALQTLDIDSNYELIKALAPYVATHTGRYADFAAAVRTAVTDRLPDLQPHIDEILSFLVLYYGVTDAPELTPPM